MGLKTFTIDFENIGKQEFLRPTFGYRYFFDIQNSFVYKYNKNIKLKYVLKEFTCKKIQKGDLENEEYLIDISNIERRFNNLINVEKVIEIGSDKNILQYGDIIIPKIQPKMGNIFLNLEHKRYLASTELLEYSISENYNPLFIYYLITSKKFLSDLEKLESGKTHRRVNSSDLLRIKIPLISEDKQNKIVLEIKTIENKIKEIRKKLLDQKEIINRVFSREFELDLEKFKEIKKEKFFDVKLSDFSTNLDLRGSVSDFKNYLIFEGSSKIIPQNKYSEISIKNVTEKNKCKLLKKGKLKKEYLLIELENVGNSNGLVFDTKEVKEITSDKLLFSDSDILTTKLRPYLGKSILNNFENEAIGTTEWIPLKINKNIIIKEYLLYILLSGFYIEKVILLMSGKNHPRIKPEILFDFKIPDIPLKYQKQIVDEIKSELYNQEEIKKQIELERNKIDEIIQNAIFDENF